MDDAPKWRGLCEDAKLGVEHDGHLHDAEQSVVDESRGYRAWQRVMCPTWCAGITRQSTSNSRDRFWATDNDQPRYTLNEARRIIKRENEVEKCAQRGHPPRGSSGHAPCVCGEYTCERQRSSRPVPPYSDRDYGAVMDSAGSS